MSTSKLVYSTRKQTAPKPYGKRVFYAQNDAERHFDEISKLMQSKPRYR